MRRAARKTQPGSFIGHPSLPRIEPQLPTLAVDYLGHRFGSRLVAPLHLRLADIIAGYAEWHQTRAESIVLAAQRYHTREEWRKRRD